MSFTLTVLGCTTPYPRPGEPCSGYLVRTPGANLWIDAGFGTFAALQEHILPQEVTALWISHLHPDHSADLLALFSWAINTPDAPRIPVYAPQGWVERVAAITPAADADDLIRRTFDVHEIYNDQHLDLADLHLHALAVTHSVPTFGLHVQDGTGHTLAYSGDTAPCDALTRLATDVDLFVCEAAASDPQPAHCTPTDAAKTARTAGSRHLLITHVPDTTARQHAADEAARSAGCPVTAAHQNQHLTVSEGRES